MNYFTPCWRLQSIALLDQPGLGSLETMKLAYFEVIFKQKFGRSHNASACLFVTLLCFELLHFVHVVVSSIHRWIIF